ncbi:MAG: transporter [Halieaceae bacterium]
MLSGLALLTLTAQTQAQDLEPRTYTNIPVGQNFVGVGYAYSDGEVNPSPSVPLRDIEITMKATVAAYVRSLDLWGKAGKVDAIWARVCQKGSGFVNEVLVKGDRCGTIDPSVRLSYLFYGAPAMDLKEFRSNPTQRVIGVSLKVDAPLGDYNNENIINTGSNRWTFKPEIGISNRWGRWSAEGAFAARLFTDNDNAKGKATLEQDPLYQLQLHVIYDLPKGRWVSLNGNYFWGGRTTKNGIKGDDVQDNSRIGLTFATPLNSQHSLKFYANRGLVSNIGNDSDTYGVVWQYRWAD